MNIQQQINEIEKHLNHEHKILGFLSVQFEQKNIEIQELIDQVYKVHELKFQLRELQIEAGLCSKFARYYYDTRY